MSCSNEDRDNINEDREGPRDKNIPLVTNIKIIINRRLTRTEECCTAEQLRISPTENELGGVAKVKLDRLTVTLPSH